MSSLAKYTLPLVQPLHVIFFSLCFFLWGLVPKKRLPICCRGRLRLGEPFAVHVVGRKTVSPKLQVDDEAVA